MTQTEIAFEGLIKEGENDVSLELRIDRMRGQLIKIAEQYGLDHPQTLALSRRLDKLIVVALKRMTVVS